MANSPADRIAILRKIEEEIGLASSELNEVEKVRTGLLPLDYVLSGGVVRPSIFEIVGHEKSGKTTVSSFLSNALMQKSKEENKGLAYPVYYLDFERTLDPHWLKLNKINLEKLMEVGEFRLIQEDGTDSQTIMSKAVGTGAVSVVVIDSFPSMLFKEEKEMESRPRGLKAKLQTEMLTLIQDSMNNVQTCFVIINQYRANQSMYGSDFNSAGPVALKFDISYKLEINMLSKSAGGYIMEGTDILGTCSKILCSKNKRGTAYLESRLFFFKEPEISLNKEFNTVEELESSLEELKYFPVGLDVEYNNFEFLLDVGLIQKGGSYYSYKDHKAQGKFGFVALLKQNPELMKELESEYWHLREQRKASYIDNLEKDVLVEVKKEEKTALEELKLAEKFN